MFLAVNAATKCIGAALYSTKNLCLEGSGQSGFQPGDIYVADSTLRHLGVRQRKNCCEAGGVPCGTLESPPQMGCGCWRARCLPP